jgi:hypothetical protein
MCDMQKNIVLFVTVVIASALIANTFAMQTIQRTIPSSGSIKGVGVGIYWDSQCTNATSSIQFGMLEPGSSKYYTLYLRNEGNAELTLNMIAENWNPTAAGNYMSVSWNREGQHISEGQTMSCVLTLLVSSGIQDISTFDLDIVITGQG